MRDTSFATPNFIADGFSMSRPERVAGGIAAARPQGGFTPEMSAQSGESQWDLAEYHNQDGFDEGLVHHHGWACDN